MANKLENIPEEFRVTITPMLSFKDALAAIEFYKKAFGAVEITRMVDHSNDKVTHAEVRIAMLRSCFQMNFLRSIS
jgi:PhnB protein